MKKSLLFIFLLPAFAGSAQDYKSLPMWNASLPVEARVKDLLGRLTPEEKVAQLMNSTPAIPRLGIPAYDWWNETLHGVARTPYHTTSYPQAIGMAATWDTASIFHMGDFSAMEGRAIHQKAVSEGKEGDRYVGLTYWTPNINIFRDPRWGRGQETYGEDPYLTAMMASAFVRGLQGNDPFYLKAAACAKHFAVHSGPEPTRHSDNINPSPHDLWDTYLPAFRQLIETDKVAGVMCAYNAVNTQPCCANDLLMQDILRKQWHFTGYVTSDCWAIDDFFRYHKTHKDAKSSAIDALIHTTDVECGNSVYSTLKDALQNKEVSEAQLDTALARLFTIRYRLGFFDPSAKLPFPAVSDATLEEADHSELALKMAEQSIVLLKNEKNTLPLSKNLKKIVVLGPNAESRSVMLGNYNGTPSKVYSLLDGIREIAGPSTQIIYEKAVDYAADSLLVYEPVNTVFGSGTRRGVAMTYFNNEKLEGEPVPAGIQPEINLNLSEGEAPLQGVSNTHYSIRFAGYLNVTESKTYQFQVSADDGYRLFVNDKLMIDAWTKNGQVSRLVSIPVIKDSICKIIFEMRQSDGPALACFRPAHYEKVNYRHMQALCADADAVIFAGGISPQLEGEEMPVAVPGFKGGDRTSISLPAVQTEMLKAIAATGKPVVFVMMTGSALAFPWEKEHIPAIVNGWYGGQSGGKAIAKVLFGDYNPGGRLPVTFYNSDDDLPAFSSYDMQGRTYRYFHKPVLYPFGYGLSYTRFQYSAIKPTPFTSKEGVRIQTTVKNTGTRDGEEVAQLYISYPDEPGAPVCALKGFQRIFLKKNESRVIRFTLSPQQLQLINATGNGYLPKSKLVISVGGSQPGKETPTSVNSMQVVAKLL